MVRATRADWSRYAPFRFAVGIEDTFIADEQPGRRKLDEYELTQHYDYWADDIDLVASSGADTLRWGIPWYRVEPEPGRFDWSWVDQVVERIAALGLTCVVDLMHYGTPHWLEGSFAHPDYPRRVAVYAAAAAERYGDTLHAWTPLNEPIVNAERCGEAGLWPPYLHGQDGFVTVIVAIAEGIVATQRAIREVQPDAAFVAVEAGYRYAGTTFPLDRAILDERCFLGLDLVMGRVGDDHALHGWLVSHGADRAALERLASDCVAPDVVGVNYYPDFSTQQYDADGTPSPVATWTEEFADYLRLFHHRYGLPLMVTETSRNTTVDGRRRWLADSIAAVGDLRREGVGVVGYTWFPFLDLVDWLYRESATPVDEWLLPMGLVSLLRQPDGRLARQATPLLQQFRDATTAGMPPITDPARDR